MRLSAWRSPAISLAAALVLVIGTAGQAFACRPPDRDDSFHLGTSVGFASLAPTISLTLGVDKPTAIPGDKLTYTARVTNSGTSLTLNGRIEVGNPGGKPATVASWFDYLSVDPQGRCGDDDEDGAGRDRHHWTPIAGAAGARSGYSPTGKPPISTGMAFTAVAVPATGVTYATGSDTITGTSIERGATARWDFTAVLPLTPTQVKALFQGSEALPIRESFHAEPSTGNSFESDAATVGNANFCRALGAFKNVGNATDVRVSVTLPNGTVKALNYSNNPALASIAPGASATATTTYTVPVVAAKNAAETDGAYLSRLAALDGSRLAAAASAKVGTGGASAGPVGPIIVTESVPVLSLVKSGQASVDPGKTASYSLAMANRGSAPAASLTLADTLPAGTVIPTSGVPASLAPHATATAKAAYAVPAAQTPGDLTDTATLRWTDANGNRYGPISSQATSKVTGPKATVIVTASSGSLTYGGTVPAITPAYSGWVGGDGPGVLTTAPVCTTTATGASGVGTYKTSCSGAVAPDYAFVYVDGSVKVTPALVTVTAPSGSMTYGGTVPAIAPAYSGWVKDEGPAVLTTAPNCSTAATSASGVGTYKTSCSGAAAANYTFSYVDGSVKVNPAPVTLTASSDSMAYGGTVPVITPGYAGWVNGDGPSVLTTAPTCSTAATSASPAGAYKTSCSGAAAANYTFGYVDGTISVNPSVVIVTASSGSLTYGGTVPAITPSYSGWQNGDGPAVLTTAPVCTTTATSASGVGTYKTSCSGAAAPNYTFSYAEGTITVTPALVTVTAPSGSMTYGATVPAIAPAYSGWVNGEGPSVLTTAPTCSTAATSASGVGTYKTSCSGAAAANYTFSYVDGSVTVNPVLVTVTASSGSMTYGGTVPVITPAYSGWINGDGPSVLTTAPTCSTAATSASPAGAYRSSCSGAAAANYTFGYVDGTISVSVVTTTGLTLSPDSGGPLPVGSSYTFTVKVTDSNGQPVSGKAITLPVAGPNATSANLTTGADGTATFTYTGAHAGTDTAQAAGTGADSALVSGTALVLWAVPVAPIATSEIHGQFFTADINDLTFLATPASTPVFAQDFPTVDFNPVAGAVANNRSGINEFSRPFTDITTDLAGNYTGSIVAAGNGAQAGVNSMNAFDAVFTGTYAVTAAGNQTFNYLSDDGWMLGIGGGATRVSGPSVNAPASGLSPFKSYALMASYNTPSSPAPNSVTVYFPAPGTYPFEIDYFEVRGGQLCLTVTTDATGHSIPPTGSIALSPLAPAPAQRGVAQTYTAAVTDLGGNPIPNLAISLNVAGANTTSLTATTDARGIATFSYASGVAGTDSLEAFAMYGGTPIISNTVAQTWTTAPAVPMIGSVAPAEGAVITAPTPVTASTSAPAGATLTDWSVTVKGSAPGSPTVTLASGSGTPPATLATFDPTVLPNGQYTISIAVDASDTTRQVLDTGVIVDGNLKLGRYQITSQDANVPVGGIPISVLRTYDSFDKSTGDFGVGWHVSVANFRIYTDGPLGAGGWSQYATSCLMPGLGGGLCQMAWTTARPHFVTVVWPDGHTEIFDFTPTGGSNLFWLGSASFTARAGSTSTLAALGDGTLTYTADGNLYAGYGGPVYAPTRFQLTAKDGSAYVLDIATGLVSETDRTGNKVTLDAAGIHSSLGPSLTFVRDTSGRITELDEPGGAKVLYSYDAAGNLASVTDERGNVVRYEYDSNHNLTKTIDPTGHPFRTLKYGPDGRLISVTDGAGNTSAISVDPNAKTETVIGPDPGLTTVTSLDARGDILQVDEVFGGKTVTTKFTYDDLGHVLSKTDPLGHTTGATYDAAGSPLTLTEADGGTWHFAYNDHEQLTSITDRTGTQIVSLEYDSYGELVRKTTADGGVTTYSYGGSGLLTGVTDPLGRTTTYRYDSAGRVWAVIGPDYRAWVYTFDGAGRTASIKDPADETTTFGYDAAGNLTSYTDALGHGQTYTYDSSGRLATATDGLGHTTSYSYDDAGRLSSTLDRNGQTTGFSYNQSGQVTTITLPGGNSLTYTYDPLGRLTDANDADATLHFVYDDAGNLLSQTSAGTSTSDQPSVTLSFTRDAAGRPTSLATPWGTTDFGYDTNGLLDKVTDPSGGVFNLGYDPLGRLASLSRPNGVNDTYAYDKAGQLSSRTSSKGDAVIDALSYKYDSSGRRATKTDASGTTTYGYDAADRLISVLAPAGSSLPNETFSYDAAGNQKQAGQTYDAANRLIADAKSDYTYDNEGNLTSKTVRAGGAKTTYAWNALHQMTSTTLPDGTVVTYRYDALGRRVEQSTSAGTTRYVNLGANVIAEYDGSNTLRASYVTTLASGDLAGMPLETTVGASSTYPLLDGVGSVTATTDASGALSSFAYTAYGLPVGASPGTYAYGTYGYDSATGLYYARARYYDPASGRFLSEDSVAAVDLYGYAHDTPSAMGDPSGLDPVVETETIDESEALAATSVFDTTNPAWRAMIGAAAGCLGDAVLQLQTKGRIDPVELVIYTIAGALAGPTIGLLGGGMRGIGFGIAWGASTQAASDLVTNQRTSGMDYAEGSLLGSVPVKGAYQLVWPAYASLLQWVLDRLRGALP